VAAWACTRLGIPRHEAFSELNALFEQGVRGDTFDQWLRAHRVPPEAAVGEMVRAYRNHEPMIQSYPDVIPVLQALRPYSRLGLVTDGDAAVQRRKLAALPQLQELFDAVVISDELGRDAWKPAPRALEAALAALQTSPENAVYIGDNPVKDFIGARRLGLATIRIRRADGLYCRIEPQSAQHAPDAEISELNQLQAALAGLRRGAASVTRPRRSRDPR